MRQSEYIDLVKDSNGLSNYTEVAKLLDVSRSAIAQFRKESISFSPELAMKIAKLTGVSKAKIAIDLLAIKAKDKSTRQFWSTAAGVTLAVIVPVLAEISRVCILC